MKNQWGGGKKLQFFKLILSILFLNNTYSADTTKKTGIDLNNILIENGFQYDRNGITLQKIIIKYNDEEFKIKTIFGQPKSDKFGVSGNKRDKQWHCDLPIEIFYNVATHHNMGQTLNDVENRLRDIIKDEVLDFKKLIENFHDSTLLIYFSNTNNYFDVYNIKSNTYNSKNEFNNHWTDMYIDCKLYENDERIKKESIPACNQNFHFNHPDRIQIILWDQKPEDKSKNDISNLSFAIQCHENNGIKLQRIKITNKANSGPFTIKTKFNQISKKKCYGYTNCRDGQWNSDLSIEIFYNKAKHSDEDQTLEDIKDRLSNIIKYEVLTFDKLIENFPDSNILIYFCDGIYQDIYNVRSNTYICLGKLTENYKLEDYIIFEKLYESIKKTKEFISKEDQADLFSHPQAIHIILCDEKKEKNKPHKNNTKDEIKNKRKEGDKSNKSNDSKIPTKTKDKNNKKGKKPSIQTPNGTTKSNQYCKCCQCCPCCKQKT